MIVAFDIDDTLVKEREFCLSGFRAVAAMVCRTVGSDVITPEKIVSAMAEALSKRENHYQALEELLRLRCLTDSIDMAAVVGTCRNHPPTFTEATVRRAQSMVSEVISRGFIPAIISDGRTVTQRNKLKGLGIIDMFSPSDILISTEQGADKREALMFRRLMNLHPEENLFVYVGDNTSKDFTWPRRLGWKTVGLRDTDDTNIHPQTLDVPPENLPDLWIDYRL
ncbi:MAG: HAD family hydrolase [Bacteroides sp.]|nr:HAD family hydrolase [Bacteroides sp.]